MVCVIVTGPSGTGKTTFAEMLVDRTGWPLVAKDKIKEFYFESLGCLSREASKDIGQLALSYMANKIRESRPASEVLVVEGNLRTAWLEATCLPRTEDSPVTFVQVQMSASGTVLESRIIARAASGERHPCHFDLSALQDNTHEVSIGRFEVARIPGTVINVDTTRLSRSGFQAEVTRVETSAKELAQR